MRLLRILREAVTNFVLVLLGIVANNETGALGNGGSLEAAKTEKEEAEQKTTKCPEDSTWGNPDTLQDHYDRHGSDFGSSDPQDYAKSANEFYNDRGNHQVKVDQNGTTRVYDPNTNTFGSYNADGTTRTFFKPTDFQAYFDRQPGI